MSKNAIRYTTATAKADRISAQELAFYRRNPGTWRSHLRPAPMTSIESERTWDRKGIAMLLSAAKAEFEAQTGVALPHNIANDGRWVHRAWAKTHSRHDYDAVGEAAKLAGFLRHAPEFPILVQLIQRTTSPRGINSPYTKVSLGDLALRWTPGAAARQLRKVMAKAQVILRPYGLRPSWASLGYAMTRATKDSRRAALIAAAHTVLGGETFRSYAEARNKLAERSLSVRLKVVEADGVRMGVQAERNHLGVQVATGWWTEERPLRRTKGYLVTIRGETFHIEEWYCRGAAEAVKRARQALIRRERTRQQQALQVQTQQGRISLPDNISVLVTREDSYAAGNCRPGTETFLATNRWSDRWYVQAEKLVATGNPLAVNAALIALQRLTA